MVAQTIGAALAGGTLHGSFGAECAMQWQGDGCFREPETITAGQALLIETMCCWVLLVLAFGVGLDPRQQKFMGPLFGLLAFGSSLGSTRRQHFAPRSLEARLVSAALARELCEQG